MTREDTSTRRSRRAVLGTGAAITAGLAGCLGGGGGSDDGEEQPAAGPTVDGLVLSAASPVLIFDPDTGDDLADVHYHAAEDSTHWHEMPLRIPAGEWTTLRIEVRNREGEPVALGPDGRLTVELDPTAETASGFLDVEGTGELVDVHAPSPGDGDVGLWLREEGERVWTAPTLFVRATSP